ncbi:MAG: alanine racemase [Sphingomonas sp.]|uniref:alanine racemase n=1 Tax=Sphingomonas sp. TaxID=28214 RepID=UPI0025EC42A4|nr:alanine racemase [Sphingomonas sp.]MBX9880528.1 alanine racemase [Sphingomonas sp.]
MTAPLRLALDRAALQHNWRALAAMAGVACGAAVKADGYGLGAPGVARILAEAGCRDFFVATWAEAAELAPLGLTVSVLHGVREADMALARTLTFARPVLNSPEQIGRWRASGGGPCDVMVDTGINRLGLDRNALDAAAGLEITTLMSHLARADEDVADNEAQRAAFAAITGALPAERYSLANSAGIALGPGFAFDLVRPGLALYGGIPRAEFARMIRPVAHPEAELLQCRLLRAGDAIGYNAIYHAAEDMPVGIVNLGYADGYPRALSNVGRAFAGDAILPVIGRVSMDLIALDLRAAPDLRAGDWVRFDFDLPKLAGASERSQYELLTGLGTRFERVWTERTVS